MKTLMISMLFVSSAFAQNYYCTEWTKQRSVSCVYAGRSADVWQRQCENPCRINREYGPHCDLERICVDVNPNELSTPCSPWVKESSTSCPNPNTGSFEQKWVRACQIGLATTWCSDKNPNRE